MRVDFILSRHALAAQADEAFPHPPGVLLTTINR